MAIHELAEDGSNLLILGGAPRSGTTFVQLLLYQTGEYATSQELHLFPLFAARLWDSWGRLGQAAGMGRDVGLHNALTEAQFLKLVRQFTSGVLNQVLGKEPGRRRVLEKTPENLLHWELIHRLYPKAVFMVIVRDPRSVVASTKAARTWAGPWAKRELPQIVETWKHHFDALLALEAATPRVIRVSYEKLLLGGVAVLQPLLQRLGIKADKARCGAILEQCSIGTLAKGEGKAPWALASEPSGFFRSGTADAWRTELSAEEIALVEELAAREMRILGYPPATPRAHKAGEGE